MLLTSPSGQRDVLATLSARRINISEIKFIGDGPIGKGGMGDVVVATIISEKEGQTELGRTVAVKKLRLGYGIDEERSLRVSPSLRYYRRDSKLLL